MKKILSTILFLACVGLAGFYFDVPHDFWVKLKNSDLGQQIKSSVENGEFLPGPLRGSLDANNTLLTRSGVVLETNKQREIFGLLPLHNNEKLSRAAQAKLDDMFAQQYFEHNSPQGLTPADVVKNANYEYIVVGENLALGNFKNNALLVEAWMNSPGHRANILHDKFQEIGVAVGKGTFEGREVWLAVQEFGTPLSSCPGPSESLKGQIEADRLQIERWQQELVTRRSELDNKNYQSQEEYNQAVQDYNKLANKTNALVEQTRNLVDTYNSQVNEFNSCLETNA